MAEYKRNIAVGLTTLAGLAGLLVLALMFGRLPGLEPEGYPLRVVLPNAGGLHEGSKVNFAGMPAGRVKSVEFRSEPQPRVIATVRIRENVQIPKGVSATVFSPLVGGSPTLELNVPRGVKSGDYVSTTQPATIDGEISSMGKRVVQQLKSSLGQPMSQIDEVVGGIKKLSAEWTRVGERVNALVEPRSLAAVDAGHAEPNLDTLVARIDQRMREFGQTLESVQNIVGDEQTIANLRATLKNARQASAKLSRRIDQISKQIKGTTQRVGASAENLEKRYLALADDLSKTVQSMQKLADQSRQGEGTVGKLVNDPALYNNLNDAAQRINKAVAEMKLLLQKWKAEGVPVQF